MSLTTDILFNWKGDDSDLSKSASKASTAVGKAGSSMQKVGGTLSKGLTLPLVGAATALGGMAIKAGENADAILDLSDIAGVSTDAIQEWRNVFTNAGVDQEKLDKALRRTNERMGQAINGNKKYGDAFAELGVELTDANGNIRNTDDVMMDVIASLNTIEDPALRAAAASDLLGKKLGPELAPVINQGTASIQEQRDAAHELGLVQSNEALKGANDFRMGIDSLKAQAGGLVATLGGAFAPILRDVVLPLIQDQIVPMIQKFADFVKMLMERFNNLSPSMQSLVGGLIGAAAAAGPVLSVGGKLVGVFMKVGQAFKALSALMAANPWLLLIAATVALVVLIVKNWDKITAFLSAAWEWIKETAAAVWEAITTAIQAALDFLVNLFMNWTVPGLIIQHWDTIKEAFSTALEFIKNLVTTVFEAVRDFIAGIIDAIFGYVSDGWNGISTTTTDVWKAIKSFISDIWNGIKSFISGVVDAIKRVIQGFLRAVQSVWNSTWNAIRAFFERVWRGWQIIIRTGISIVRGAISGFVSFMTSAWGRVWTFVRDAVQRAWDFIKGIARRFFEIGRSIITGILNGLGNIASALYNKLKSGITSAINKVKSFFGIGSPSKVLALEVGVPFMQGVATGVEDATDESRKRILRTMKRLQNSFALQAPSVSTPSAVGAFGRASSGIVVNVTVEGSVQTADDLANTIADRLALINRRRP